MSATLARDLERLRAELRALTIGASVPKDAAELARRAGIEPDAWQRDLLLSEARQMILLCSRQAGKSTVSALLAVHEALSRPKSLVLLAAPAQRQSQESLRKIKDILAALGTAAAVEEESALRVEFANGSRILALPGSERTVRGFSAVNLLVEDESARVPDELFMATRPMLATSAGRTILLSTPFGRRGHFYETWANGGPDWYRAKVTAFDVPRIPRDWLEKERATMGDFWFRQEFLIEFVDELTACFPSALIEAAMDASILPLFGPPPTQPEAACVVA